jgi:hypothetical protein
MGMGRFKNGKFDLVVVANFAMSGTDVTEWRRSFQKASELFWDASEGQLQYGRIFVCDESVGADFAEIILHASGDPSYGTWGKFGVPGQALHLMPYVKFQVLTHHHEMGHHVWALDEEYAAEAVLEQIDTAVVPLNNFNGSIGEQRVRTWCAGGRRCDPQVRRQSRAQGDHG